MTPVIVNQSKSRVPRQFVVWACDFVLNELKKRRVFKKKQTPQIVLVFLDKKEAKKLNQEFRGKDYATDVLSFESIEDGVLGELIFCPDVLKKQAKDHCLSQQFELGYMLIHGVLHLLGYDHEENDQEAKEMYALQDSIFESLCENWKKKSKSK